MPTIAFISPKGGVGKTSAFASFGASYDWPWRRLFLRAAILQINGYADRVEAVIADVGCDARSHGPTAHHGMGSGRYRGVSLSLFVSRLMVPNNTALGPVIIYTKEEILFEQSIAGHFMPLTALLTHAQHPCMNTFSRFVERTAPTWTTL